jgi:D-alanyl-D-alanine carboxypeptidase
MKRCFPFLILLFSLHPLKGNAQITPDTADSNQIVSPDTTENQIPPEPVVSLSIKEEAESIRKIRGVPGMVYAVFSKDSIIEIQSLGYRVFKSKDQVEINDRFNIGTNTAAFTAYIAARLVEEKKINWNTQLLKIFPEFSEKTLPVYKSISLQDLLSSRTRLPPFMEYSDWFKIPNFKGKIIAKRKSYTYWMLQHKPNMENFLQKKIIFSLAGYVMAASMMEKVTGKSWEDLVFEYIRKPMKISMRYSWPNIYDPNAPAGHWNQGGSFHAEEPETWVKGDPVLYPGQAISISISDYIKYMQENLQGLAGGKTKLSNGEFEFLYFGIPDYSMGWNNGSLNNQSFAFHEGLSLLFNCRTEILKEKNIGIIVMCNSGDRDGRGAVFDVTRLLEEKYF